jgi:hypothetical protein
MLTPQDVNDNFELLDDWESWFAYLADLGEALTPHRVTGRALP